MDREHGRRRWIINRKLERHRSTEIATALRVDERTVYRWWSVYRKHGWAELAVKSHRPHMIHRTPRPTAELILQLRRTRNWGPCRIEAWGRPKCLAKPCFQCVPRYVDLPDFGIPIHLGVLFMYSR